VANAAIERVAASTGSSVCRLDDLSGWVELWPDAVHPTAVGQLAIADRAARALGAATRPSELADPPGGRRKRLRHAPTYVRSAIRERVRALAERP
jgi:hypothetical protein